MKRLLIIVFACIGTYAHAQSGAERYNNPAISAGIELQAPDKNGYKIGYGASAKAELPMNDLFSLSVTAGYTALDYRLAKNKKIRTPADFIPLKAGAKFFFGDGIYTEGEAGAVIETNYTKDKKMVFSIGPGLIVPTGKHTGIDMGIRFEEWGSKKMRETSFRIAYRLG